MHKRDRRDKDCQEQYGKDIAQAPKPLLICLIDLIDLFFHNLHISFD